MEFPVRTLVASRKHIVRALTAAAALTLALSGPDAGAQVASPRPEAAVADSQIYELHLEAQPLDAALAALAAATGWQIDHGSVDSVAALSSAPAVGPLTFENALRRMLMAARLSFRRTGPRRVALRRSTQLLPELSVTAERERVVKTSSGGTKIDALLIETPQAISVVTSEQIEAQSAQNMQEVLRYSPGVRAEMYGLDNRGDWFTLRGGSEGSTVLDGLRLPLSGWYGNVRNEPYAFDRVEVVRGPASVLYGQNGPGGVVNLVSKLPQARPQREISAQLGNREYKEVGLDFTGPLDAEGTLLYRLVALGKDTETQVRFADEERQLVSPSLTWLADANTTVTAYGQYQRDRSKNNVGFFPWAGTLLPAPNGRISDDVFIGEPEWDSYGGRRLRAGYQVERRIGRTWSLRHNLRYEDVNGHLRGMYANYWEGFREDGRTINRTWYATRTDTRIANADVLAQGKLSLGGMQHTVLLGVDGFWLRDVNPNLSGEGTPLDVYAPVYGTFAVPALDFGPEVPTRTRQLGLMIQDHIKLDDRVVLLAGLRRDEATVEVEGAPESGAEANAWTHRVGMVYLAGRGFSPYASYSTSFQLYNGTDRLGRAFQPIRGRQWETGVKWMPESGRHAVTAAAYVLKERNRPSPDPVDPLFQVQKGEVTVKGVEVDITMALGGLELIGNYTYTDARVSASSDPLDPYLDRRLASIPEHSASLWLTQGFGAFGLDGFRAGAGARYVDKTWDGTDVLATPSNTLVDAMFSFDYGRWRYAVHASNVFDETYFATCLDRGDCWFGSRRNVSLRTTYRF
jgi:iron complex outermembrane receptor protein